MFVKIRKKVVQEITNKIPLDQRGWVPAYMVYDNFYKRRWNEERGRILFISPCEMQEDTAYDEQQEFMVYEVYDDDLYTALSGKRLEDIVEQSYADSLLDSQ